MNRRTLGFFGLIAIALLITTGLFLYAKGYRFNFRDGTVAGTGILQIGSNPKGAAVFLNGEKNPRDATDVSLTNLTPGKYELKLAKNGFIDWKKTIDIRSGLVTQVEALLFPSAPNLKAITFSGVTGPQISPDHRKLAYQVDQDDKKGIWVLDLSDQPIFFSREPKQIVKDTDNLVFSKASFLWTPDSKSLLVTLGETGSEQNFLLDTGELNQNFSDVSSTVSSLKSGWANDASVKAKEQLNSLGDDGKKLANGADSLLYSPNEERVLIVNDGNALVYDTKPPLSFDKKPEQFTLPKADSYIWYPETSHDSRHLILIRKDSISIVESDGTNEMTIYTGNFDPKAVFAWPNGSQILILTSLNSTGSKNPNLYGLALR